MSEGSERPPVDVGADHHRINQPVVTALLDLEGEGCCNMSSHQLRKVGNRSNCGVAQPHVPEREHIQLAVRREIGARLSLRVFVPP
jgi:hypothetical protein